MRKLSISLLLVMALLASVWAKEFRMKTSSDLVPSAAGKVELDKDRNGNRVAKVRVYHLPDPEKLNPAKNAYVVWIQAKGKDPENVGVLKVNEDLEGKLEATTPYNKFEVFITAEDNPKPDRPSGPEILRAEVD
jgi:hypothetical protein